jgi:chromosome segregation ATPase
MSQFNIDKNKYDEALRKSCKGKIAEEKRLQGKVNEVTLTLQKLYREKHTIINDIEEKQSLSARIQLKVDDLEVKLASLREDVRITEIGLESKAERLDKEKEDFRKEKEAELKRLSDEANSLALRELKMEGFKDRNRKESDRLESDAEELKSQQKKFDEERLNFKEQQHKFSEEKKKHDEENAKYKADISRIQSKEKEQAEKDKTQMARDDVLEKKSKNLDAIEALQKNKDIEQGATQVRLDEQSHE